MFSIEKLFAQEDKGVGWIVRIGNSTIPKTRGRIRAIQRLGCTFEVHVEPMKKILEQLIVSPNQCGPTETIFTFENVNLPCVVFSGVKSFKVYGKESYTKITHMEM